MESTINLTSILDQPPLIDLTFSNAPQTSSKIYQFIQPILDFIFSSNTWHTVGVISGIASIIFLSIMIFSLVRILEIQKEENEKLDMEITEALLRQAEREKNVNPRWHYIQTLVESPNESDWRVAIIEADTMMEEVLKEKGISGGTVSELLESAKSSGYPSIQKAWDAHLIRNQIAHEGVEFPLSQIEARRAIKMYQNFFEDLGVIQ